jgi:hypothetical protein
MKKTLIVCFLLVVALPVFSQYKAVVELNKNSSLSIFVETNRMNFCLVQKGDKLLSAPVALSASIQKKTLMVDHNKLDIDVKGFKSDNLIAQGEFYKLMMVDKFPRMKIELLRFDSSSDNNTSDLSSGTALLNITITNVTRKYEFPVLIYKGDGLMRIAGKKKLSITDFGLTAPRNLLFGMVRINDLIEINLDFQCRLRLKSEDVADVPVR